MIMACRPWTDLHPQPLGFLTGCLAVCTGWGGPEPWNPVTGFKPAGASLLKAVGSFWGEDSRDLSLSLDRKSCGFCYYQLEMLPIRRVVADSIATNRSVSPETAQDCEAKQSKAGEQSVHFVGRFVTVNS